MDDGIVLIERIEVGEIVVGKNVRVTSYSGKQVFEAAVEYATLLAYVERTKRAFDAAKFRDQSRILPFRTG